MTIMKNIKFSPPDITEAEINEVVDTLKSGWITTGPKTKLFEKEIANFCGTNKAACLNSATACLEMTLRILGIGPGDEVITSAYTYTASCSPICHVGATPVLVDTKENSFFMDYEKLKDKITAKTKAIISVDLAGKMCDYDEILKIVDEKSYLFNPNSDIQKKIGRIAVIADSAHGFGAKYKGRISGSVADFTTFSFHAVKNLTTAEGGALVWKSIEGIDDEQIYKELMLLSLHGQSKDALAKMKPGLWEYDILMPGYKCNMTDIMAAIGLAQLKRYPAMLKRRREIIELYNDKLSSENVTLFSHYNDNYESSGHLYLLNLNGKDENFRNKLIEFMAKHGIPTNVHYKPLPLFTAYKQLSFNINDFKNAFNMYKNEITLPLHNLLSDEDVLYIAETLKKGLG